MDEEKFYNYRFGGGTTCSSALKFIAKQFENRYNPHKWNIYVFYFTDGDNWSEDNKVFIDTLRESFPENLVNMVGITQIMPWNYTNSVKHVVDQAVQSGDVDKRNVRTAEIGSNGSDFTEEMRNEQIMEAIKTLMGSDRSKIKFPKELEDGE